MSLRDKILNSADRPLTKVPVPEWDCDIWLRPLNVSDRTKVIRAGHSGDGSFYGLAVVLSVVDEEGNLLFTEDDITALVQKNGAVLDRLATQVIELNALVPKAVDDAKNG